MAERRRLIAPVIQKKGGSAIRINVCGGKRMGRKKRKKKKKRKKIQSKVDWSGENTPD